MYGITAFINVKTIEPQKNFGFLNKKTKSNFGSYVLVDELIEDEDFILPFNSMQEELIYMGSRERTQANLFHLMIEFVLQIIAVDYPNFNEKVVIYMNDKDTVYSYNKKVDELAKQYGYEELIVNYVTDNKNLFTASMLMSPAFLTTYEAERVYLKHMSMVSNIGTVKSTKAKQIQELSFQNTELKLRLQKITEIASYYQNKCSKQAT